MLNTGFLCLITTTTGTYFLGAANGKRRRKKMAANETQFQTEMVESTRAAGGTCWKMKSLSQNGIPDLHILTPRVKGWIECKFWDAHKLRGKPSGGGSVKPKASMSWLLKTTAKQKERIRELHAGNSAAGWAVCVKVSHNRWDLYVGVHEEKKFCKEDFYCTRMSGENWPVENIIREIEKQHAKYMWQD
jgi:G:T-mismatch repair DNA endonuclease (very short patch repair protein)